MRHQAGNEMHVTGQPVELGDGNRTAKRPRLGERSSQLRPPFQRIAPLAGFHLGELRYDVETLSSREPGERFPLRLDAEAGPTLLACADSDIGDHRLMVSCNFLRFLQSVSEVPKRGGVKFCERGDRGRRKVFAWSLWSGGGRAEAPDKVTLSRRRQR